MDESTTSAKNTLEKKTVRIRLFTLSAGASWYFTYPDHHTGCQVRSRSSDLVQKHIGGNLHKNISNK